MKSEETKFEETLYEDNQVNPSNEVSENEEASVAQEKSEKDGSAWRKAGVGMGLGILLGTTTSFVTSSVITGQGGNSGGNTNGGNTNGGGTNDGGTNNGEQPVWSDGKVEIATTVNDEMSFSQAFGAARAEVGAGGAFEWRGNVYSTYTAEEWNSMSAEERDTYNDHFNWSRHEATAASQTATAETTQQTAATTQQTTTTEEPAKPETVVTADEEEEPVVTVDVDVQETTPEVEILGVAHDDATGVNIGLMTVDEQEILFIDVDNDGYFDAAASDVNGDGEITQNEIADISDSQMSVSDFESNSFGGSSMYASNDGTTDYINDADDAYDMA